jgi:cardiolipin synthase A/B
MPYLFVAFRASWSRCLLHLGGLAPPPLVLPAALIAAFRRPSASRRCARPRNRFGWKRSPPPMYDGVSEAVTTSLWTHLIAVGGFLLAVFALARLMRDKRQPGNTMAWLLVIVLIPYLGVPLFLLLGGRKIKRLAARKTRVDLHLSALLPPNDALNRRASVQSMIANGAAAPVTGNTLHILADGVETFHTFERLIAEAQHSIHITTFILGRDGVGRRLLSRLSERASAGVKVRLLIDAFGSFYVRQPFLAEFIAAGGEVTRFLPVLPLATRASANLRNHRKIALFDQSTAIVGGHNLAREYLGPEPWKHRFADFGAVIRGPAAAVLNEVFLADWAFGAGQDLATLRAERDPTALQRVGEADLQIVASGPDIVGDPLYEGILSLIHEAEHSIWIVTPYYIPDEVLQRSLVVKARAGKDVTLIVPARSNHRITDFARRHYLRELHQAGARILLYGPGMMHAKAMIVDDRAAMFGSANFDLRSLFVNFEIGVAIYSEPEVTAMRRWAGALVRECRPYSSARDERPGPLQNLAEDLSRLVAPLL